jgi:uncharacterized membrane protein YczE
MKLALAQIISGALIALSDLLLVICGMSIEHADASYPSLMWYKILILLLGLVVFGVGIAQYIKARGMPRTYGD